MTPRAEFEQVIRLYNFAMFICLRINLIRGSRHFRSGVEHARTNNVHQQQHQKQ